MPDFLKKTSLLLSLSLSLLLLAGCGRVNVQESSGETLGFSKNTTELSAVLTAEELSQLDQLPKLQSVDLSGSDCYAEMIAWAAAHPEVALRYTVPLPDGSLAENSAESLDLPGLRHEQVAQLRQCLPGLPALKRVNLGGSGENDLRAEDLALLREENPGIAFVYTPRFQGQVLDSTVTSLDLSRAEDADLEELIPWLSELSGLRSIQLGDGGDAAESRISWEHIRALREGCPSAELSYRFTLYGRETDLDETVLDLNHITMDDQGALVKAVTLCMPKLQRLDMDFCNVDDEHMAEIRDALPDTEVIWRIWFGTGYSVRTDVERILASNPDKAGELRPENTRSLKYCTKVKYLDLGHNSYLGTIDFCAYMPDLEVVIFAMDDFCDVSPLANCSKLEYAELQTSRLNSLYPIAGLRNLKHLNICYDFALTDIRPLYEMHQLERLWIGCLTPIPLEQVETFQKLNPQCKVDLESVDPTQTYWRYLGMDETGSMIREPRYLLLREQFGYDNAPYCYSYIENDPLYYPHG